MVIVFSMHESCTRFTRTSTEMPPSPNIRSLRPRRQHQHRQSRGSIARAINALRGFAEILLLRHRDVHKRLRVAVHQREPGALDVNHYAVTAAEGMKDV